MGAFGPILQPVLAILPTQISTTMLQTDRLQGREGGREKHGGLRGETDMKRERERGDLTWTGVSVV